MLHTVDMQWRAGDSFASKMVRANIGMVHTDCKSDMGSDAREILQLVLVIPGVGVIFACLSTQTAAVDAVRKSWEMSIT